MKMRIATTAATVLGLAIAASPVSADEKLYPGSMGVKTSGPTPSYSAGTIGNSATTTNLYVYLPVINDNTGSGIDESHVKVLDRSPTSSVRCTINAVYWNETFDSWFGFWGAEVFSSGSGDNLQELNTGSATHGSTRHEYVYCRIPVADGGSSSDRSYIASYFVSE